jgi:phenylacetate-CoA ligase
MNPQNYYDDLEIMSPSLRKQYLEQKLQEHIQYAYANAPAMKNRLDKANIKPTEIRTVKDLEQIPVLRKDEMIELRKASPPFGGFLGIPTDRLQMIFMSPGPLYDADPLTSEENRKVGPRTFHALGFKKGDLVVNTWSYHMVPAGHWTARYLMGLGCTVIPMGVGNTELQVQVLKDMKVTGWVGTASFLITILNKAEEMGLNPKRDFSLSVAFAGGEMGGGPIRRTIEDKYGIATGDMYVTADVGPIAYECSQKKGLHLHPEMIVEIVDPNTGQQLGPGDKGEVVITPFDKTYPLIRFGTGDLSSFIDDPCACGRTSDKLPLIMGRVGDAVRTRGMFIHPRQIAEVAARFSGISRYQAVVTRPKYMDHITFKVELKNETTDKKLFQLEFGKAFQEICRCKIDTFEFVEQYVIQEGSKGIIDQRSYQ